jgi:hypothetical protein
VPTLTFRRSGARAVLSAIPHTRDPGGTSLHNAAREAAFMPSKGLISLIIAKRPKIGFEPPLCRSNLTDLGHLTARRSLLPLRVAHDHSAYFPDHENLASVGYHPGGLTRSYPHGHSDSLKQPLTSATSLVPVHLSADYRKVVRLGGTGVASCR